MNRWGIPEALEREIRLRDADCVYCRTSFVAGGGDHRRRASWEHIVNDASIVTLENIALCCVACNASKGAKPLSRWLDSNYCRRRGITAASVAPVVQAVLRTGATQGAVEPRAKPDAPYTGTG